VQHFFYEVKLEDVNRVDQFNAQNITGMCSDAPSNSKKDSKANPKMKIMKEERIGACSLACSTSRVRRVY
jgi:hypothetical protein